MLFLAEKEKKIEGSSLVVQWLGLCVSTGGGNRLDPWSGSQDRANLLESIGKKKFLLTIA